MNIVESVGQPRRVIEIAQGGGTVLAGANVHHVRRGPAGADMHPVAGKRQFMTGPGPMQDNIPPESGNGVLDHGGRKTQAALPVHRRPRPDGPIHQPGRRIGQSDSLQNMQNRAVHRLQVRPGQGLKTAAGEARPHHVGRRLGRPLLYFSAAAAASVLSWGPRHSTVEPPFSPALKVAHCKPFVQKKRLAGPQIGILNPLT